MNKNIKNYYRLSKPGIIYGNAIPAIAGFLLASKWHIDIFLLFAMLLGLSFVIGSACVFNNYIDREIDKKMERTKHRALVENKISVKNALIFAIILGLIGFCLLIFATNILTAFIAFVGFFFYVVMYSIWKRKSSLGTIVGSVSGAVPPVVGYCAVTNNLDAAAIILFLILVFWQMPHFYAIAIFRKDDYSTAGIPVLPIKQGIRKTKIHILSYIVAFIFTCSLLTFFGYTNYWYLLVSLLLGLTWLMFAIKGFKTEDNKIWARKMFGMSLVVLTIICLVMAISPA